MKFTVERSSWDRGNGNGMLVGPRGNCCLGFLGLACGMSEEDLREIGVPEETVEHCREDEGSMRWPKELVYWNDERGRYRDRSCVGDIVDANDDARMDDAEREARLTALFSRIGIDVEFVP